MSVILPPYLSTKTHICHMPHHFLCFRVFSTPYNAPATRCPRRAAFRVMPSAGLNTSLLEAMGPVRKGHGHPYSETETIGLGLGHRVFYPVLQSTFSTSWTNQYLRGCHAEASEQPFGLVFPTGTSIFLISPKFSFI